MMKVSLSTCLLAAWVAAVPLKAQEKVTNAFDDLKRSGTVNERFSEMRVKASPEQMDALLQQPSKSGAYCFVEDRLHDIRLTDALPASWMSRTAAERTRLVAEARPGEYYVWQIGVYAARQPLQDVTLEFSDLKNGEGDRVDREAVTCFNTGGIDTGGKAFRRKVLVPQGKVQALWVGVDLPADAAGTYRGHVTVKAGGHEVERIEVALTVKGELLADHGDDEGWRKSRLRWLNATVGESEEPTAPYIALRRDGRSLHWLGGTFSLNEAGLPEAVTTRFDASNQLADVSNEVLAGAMRFVIETADGEEELSPARFRIERQTPAEIQWSARMQNRRFTVNSRGVLGFDGIACLQLEVKARREAEVRDIRLEVPYTDYASRYLMGLGHKGGLRPDSLISWRWDVHRHQDKVWMGNVNAGLNLRFKDDRFVRPLVNIYYALGPLRLPDSWGNGGRGGIRIAPAAGGVTRLVAYSGARTMKKGECQHFNVDLQVTPVKPIDLRRHAAHRFYHSNSDLSRNYIAEAKKGGATHINVHHKKDIYPFINYPYYDESVPELKRFIDAAHSEHLGVRLYYTTRELTVKVPELWALRSLGSEVIHDGPGPETRTLIHRSGPNPWLNENLGDHFIPAWYNAFREGKYAGDMDISVITTPDSRWNNYYLSGLDWMVRRLGIDGIYIDDSALDRATLRRARRILDADGRPRSIDIHSWNHMNQWAGYANSLHLYTELLPYIDHTWIGEGFRADNRPDYWLVEMSGIPFGLMSETLDARNVFRGMVFGMPPRLPWSGNPVPLWQLWDRFGLGESRMHGYWDSACPVSTNCDDVYATVFVRPGAALVAVANWSGESRQVDLQLDERLLGFRPGRITLPQVGTLQEQAAWTSLKGHTVAANGGWLILLEK